MTPAIELQRSRLFRATALAFILLEGAWANRRPFASRTFEQN
jgi:hypothetical protein